VSIIAETCPTICVLHDFWLLTGRCAYTAGCTKLRTGCDQSCPTPSEYPALEPGRIAEAWLAKRLMLSIERRLTLAAYTPSAAAFARSAFCSGASAAGAIPNVEEFRLGIPVDVYSVQDRAECRGRLGLPLDRFIILLSAVSVSDKRKGGEHLVEVLRRIGPDAKVTCCVLGVSSPIELPGVDVRLMGFVDDPHQIATIYAAADVFVGPSFEETFGQVFVEAAACGTPAIGYPVTGVKDAIRDGITGRLATGVGPNYLEEAIRELHGDADLRARLSAWGPIYVQNEWSIEAAYRQFFLMLRRLKILDGQRIPPRIHFLGEAGAGSATTSIELRMPSWSPIEGIGEVEGPYPEFGLSFTFHWCCGPVSWAALHCADHGRYVLLIEYHNNSFSAQHVSISIDGERIRSLSLARTLPNTTGLLACVVDLTRGKHELQLSFSHCLEPTPSEPRRLALAVSRIYFERAG
jgi:glycosyltransferase involved in cell wall biosynthesis